MPGWLLVSYITAVVMFGLLALAVGLIENHILKSDECCGDDRTCLASMEMEWNAFYNNWTGLRTRFIVFVFSFYGAIFVRWKESDSFPPSFAFLLYVIFLVSGVLSADSAAQNFPILCEVSSSILELAEFCAWLSMAGNMVVFYIWTLNLPASQWWRGFHNPSYIDDMGYVKDMAALGVVEEEERFEETSA